MIVDGQDHVLGRLATSVVEELKKGEEVDIFNADKIIVKGNPEKTVQNYRNKYQRGSRDHGPKYPKAAHRIVKRTIKGMLPNNKEGRKMLKKVKAYSTEPEEEPEHIDDAKIEDLRGSNFITVGEISEKLGA